MLSKLHQGHLFFESTTAPFEVADNPSSVQDKARFPTAFLSLARTEILDLSDGSNNAEEHFSKANSLRNHDVSAWEFRLSPTVIRIPSCRA